MIKALLNIAQISNNNSGIPAQAEAIIAQVIMRMAQLVLPTRWNCFLFFNFQSE